ncbi:Dyp-type peroxidase [Paraglaciecola aquimarina]|uniref:Dyp-type peroxidase n=1 Tax=Paraglaciecola aquimarina TaxID=1235557 RepID=A0ABU3SSF0_9ALTE|nr:Dyp-type peroxidase [Paraglaciecola aquimarina]MDU0352897.1 Dyp-type peroxidase [Paraglaciecola aquimarina]
MSQAQKGICAEPNLHALYLTFTVVDDEVQAMRGKLAHVLDLFNHYDEEYYEAMVSGVIAIGTDYWYELYPRSIPQELAPFPDMHCEDRGAPITPGDLFIQIKADRADICHAIGAEVIQLLKPHVDLYEEISSFRYLDGRDLTGFVDGTENPKGMHKLEVAIVGDQDPEFAGGSYIHVQRYRHLMTKWQLLAEQKQEQIYGRSKADNIEFASDKKAAFAHTKRTNLKDPAGKSVEILRQSMPYGNMTVQGLFFISCACSPQPFTDMLRSMIFGDEHGNYDKLLDFTVAETGGAYFAPSVKFIKQHATDH